MTFEEKSQSEIPQHEAVDRREQRTARLRRAMRLCLKLRQGASPLRPRPPFPWEFDCKSRGEFVKGSLRRQKAPPLTNSPRSDRFQTFRGKGAQRRGCNCAQPPVGRPRRVAQNSKREKCT